MSDQVVYGNTLLNGVNKAGHLTADANGYYTVVLGALGVENSAGEVYTDTTQSRQTFEQNGTLMRRISQGLLRGEYGHPDPADHPNYMAFERRVRMIKEDRVSHHISKVWLDKVEHNGTTVMGILGKVKPSGPYGEALREALQNPEENVTFSGRYYSNVSVKGGKRHREIHTVGTWDYVSEPGIAMASKYHSPSLESHGDLKLDEAMLEQAVAFEDTHRELAVSMESSGMLARELMGELGFSRKRLKSRKSMQW